MPAKVARALLGLVLVVAVACSSAQPEKDSRFVSYRVDLRTQTLRLYWKDDVGQPLHSLQRLNAWLQGRGQRLVFGMNAGMYKADNAPQGLFIQDSRVVTPLDTTTGSGNFYLLPNGVFYTTVAHQAVVCPTAAFRYSKAIAYATQSGPMLVVGGRIHPAFKPGSPNLNVRNGVGVLPDGRVVCAMSKEPISLYDFAEYFRRQGCRNALYLDGLVSRTYLPEQQWVQTDGNFGVMIGVTEPR
ncbi:phosphodiester glycosidase family protein [Hymenobacter lucidus]|uniref:Phosphodiester glycosidase family protein n=1 Tax=Hymenobacter lucidus TaxID=2880930 RepID=A0ABS8AXQ6_9BACT|nr:phosphodiester glycosidase family protein [Hymenobacter lucidus]MCB2410581.1 phosphodiester glycosidase family protein [Hymenobacter lucidus]